MSSDRSGPNAIVVGSGIGGLACAAALARCGKAVLVIEQQRTAGGLTQTFSRNGFRWDVGLHYLGEMGPDGEARAVIDWLSGEAITFAPLGDTYDVMHFPGDFTVHFMRSRAALELELKAKFPDATGEIDAFFAALADAMRAGRNLFVQRALTGLLADLYGLWHGRDIRMWWDRTLSEVVGGLVSDPRLRAVLLAQKGDYSGGDAAKSSFGIHAVVMGHYLNGGYYPVGGAGVFAETLVPVIERAGGAVRLNATAQRLLVDKGAVTGVQLHDGSCLFAPAIFSDIGARNTVGLLPEEMQQSAWVEEIRSFSPSACHVTLYLGLTGDIRAHGASTSNHWFHATWETHDNVWQNPLEAPSAPVLFVSFPSLKDPAHVADNPQRHTAEVVATINWDLFERWRDSSLQDRPPAYKDFKAAIGRNMLAQFARHFPDLAPMVTCHEISTPLTMSAYRGAERGASYGLEVSPRRFLSDALKARTPIPGLYLAGQDVTSPGVAGAMMGGVLSAAAVAHQIYFHVR